MKSIIYYMVIPPYLALCLLQMLNTRLILFLMHVLAEQMSAQERAEFWRMAQGGLEAHNENIVDEMK